MFMQQSVICRKFHGVLVTYSGHLHGIRKMQEYENHVDDMQMRQTDESWWMMSQTSHTKTITQINHINSGLDSARCPTHSR